MKFSHLQFVEMDFTMIHIYLSYFNKNIHTTPTEQIAPLEKEDKDVKQGFQNDLSKTDNGLQVNVEHQKLLVEYKGVTGRTSQGIP